MLIRTTSMSQTQMKTLILRKDSYLKMMIVKVPVQMKMMMKKIFWKIKMTKMPLMMMMT